MATPSSVPLYRPVGAALAVTGADGRFSVSVAPGTELQISYVGFATKAVMVRNGVSNYDVTLSDDSRALNEVVCGGLWYAEEGKPLWFLLPNSMARHLGTAP